MAKQGRQTIGVFFGGQSAEHDVSIITALVAVIRPLKLGKKYNVVPVYIAKDGRWYSDEKLSEVTFYQKNFTANLAALAPVSIELGSGLALVTKGLLSRGRISIDIAFPAMHGTNGEDGALMGLLEMADIPYVGCDLHAAAICMDQIQAKQIAAANGIEATPWVWCTADEVSERMGDVIERTERLRYPLFVKPARLGSSIGITKVKQKDELSNALEVAAHFGERIIIEQGVANLVEVTLPVIGNTRPMPAYLEQPLVQAEDFFDFETKYIRGNKTGGQKSGVKGAQGYSKIPAELPETLYQRAEQIGLAVYRALDCAGIARVDMLVDTQQEKVFFNEVNPLPGSLYSHNWQRKGVSNVELVNRLVEYAEERFTRLRRHQTTFETNFLQQF